MSPWRATGISYLPLAASLALLIAGLWGLGLLGSRLAPAAFASGPAVSGEERARALALTFALGLLVNQFLLLLLGSVVVTLVASAAGAIVGLLLARRRATAMLHIGWVGAVVTGGALAVFAVPIVLLPISSWDARSIWFFHAKIIHFEGALGPGPWTDAAAASFGHMDYPKLLGGLAAQLATLVGGWNEFAPKAALIALLLPILLGLCAFGGAWLSWSGLVALLLLLPGEMMWNGYMDGYFALYAAVSLLFLGRWLRDDAAPDLVAGLVFLGVAMNLKNEGLLYAFATLMAVVALRLMRVSSSRVVLPAGEWVLVAMPVACVVLWSVKKALWGIDNDLQLGAGSLPRIVERLAAGDGGAVASALLVGSGIGPSVAALAIAASFGMLERSRIAVTATLGGATAMLYLAGLAAIYLGTPHELEWHLETSAGRTALTAVCVLTAATFLVLQELERRAGAKASNVEYRA